MSLRHANTPVRPPASTQLSPCRQYNGLRSFRALGDDKLEQINVYSIDTGGCDKREVDGNFSKTWCVLQADRWRQSGGLLHPPVEQRLCCVLCLGGRRSLKW